MNTQHRDEITLESTEKNASPYIILIDYRTAKKTKVNTDCHKTPLGHMSLQAGKSLLEIQKPSRETVYLWYMTGCTAVDPNHAVHYIHFVVSI